MFRKLASSDKLSEMYHEKYNRLFFFSFEFPKHIETKVPGNLKSGSVRIYIFIHVDGKFVFVLERPRWRRQDFL